jgi:hypothetical protein
MVKGKLLDLGILANSTFNVKILKFFKIMNYSCCSPSHWKDEFKLGIGHYQPTLFVDGNNSWKLS